MQYAGTTIQENNEYDFLFHFLDGYGTIEVQKRIFFECTKY